MHFARTDSVIAREEDLVQCIMMIVGKLALLLIQAEVFLLIYLKRVEFLTRLIRISMIMRSST